MKSVFSLAALLVASMLVIGCNNAIDEEVSNAPETISVDAPCACCSEKPDCVLTAIDKDGEACCSEKEGATCCSEKEGAACCSEGKKCCQEGQTISTEAGGEATECEKGCNACKEGESEKCKCDDKTATEVSNKTETATEGS